jgi:hypothetical protein
VADEELASQGADEAQGQEAPVEEEQREPTASEIAAEMGWRPKDQWTGDPEAWKPADQFIRDGREIQQTTARELRSVREQIERMGQVTETIVQDKLAERDAEWQRKMAKAVDDGDTEAALKLADQRPAAKAANGTGPDPLVAAWTAKNPWFNTDPLARVRAEELSNRLAHLPVPEQLAQVERAMKREFPEHFPAQSKQPPATQTGGSRNPNPSNRAKGFADMPLASQQVALDYEKRLGVPKEQTAKSYWQDQEGVRR